MSSEFIEINRTRLSKMHLAHDKPVRDDHNIPHPHKWSISLSSVLQWDLQTAASQGLSFLPLWL